MRGAGANFGVVVSFEFEAERVGQVAFAQLAFDATDAAALLECWGSAIETADRRVTGEVILRKAQAGRQIAQAILVGGSDDPDTVIEHLEPIAQIAPLIDPEVSIVPYDDVLRAFGSGEVQHGASEPLAHCGLARHLTLELATAAAALLDAGTSYWFQIRAAGGAVADVPADATAYGWRNANL